MTRPDSRAPSTTAAATGDRLRRAADLLARYRFQFWHYGDSIGFEGLLAATALLGDNRYAGYAHGAVRAWAARKRAFAELDNTAPGHVMCLLFEETGDDAVLEAAARLAAALRERRRVQGAFVSFERTPLRPPYGGERVSGPEAALLAQPGAGVFVDCLHFDPPFLAHLGALVGDSELVDLAVAQALAYIDLLQDGSGLFWHFWLERTGSRYGYAWGRGQGWALLGLLDLLRYVPSEHPGTVLIRQALVRLASALREHQRDDGGWPAVVADETSGEESSTAAFAAAGFLGGVEQEVLDRSYLEPGSRAWRFVCSRVDERGVLAGVSDAVWASTAASHYRHVPTGLVVPWGQGALLVAAQRASA